MSEVVALEEAFKPELIPHNVLIILKLHPDQRLEAMNDHAYHAINNIVQLSIVRDRLADKDFIIDCLRYMTDKCRLKNGDVGYGKRIITIYYKRLCQYTKKELQFLTEYVCFEGGFLPEPNQMAEIIEQRYKCPDKMLKSSLLKLQSDYRHVLFKKALNDLEHGSVSQSQVDQWKEPFKRIAWNKGLLTLRNGRYLLRNRA